LADWKTSGGVKVERAKEHIRNLEAELIAFAKRHPYDTIGKLDDDTREFVVRARDIRERPDPKWGAIAGDAIHNLRSSLDILWRHVTTAPGTKPDLTRGGGFPIYATRDAFENTHCKGKVESRLKAPVKVLKALKPYKGGNDLL
jgi:hypothetical protein